MVVAFSLDSVEVHFSLLLLRGCSYLLFTDDQAFATNFYLQLDLETQIK